MLQAGGSATTQVLMTLVADHRTLPTDGGLVVLLHRYNCPRSGNARFSTLKLYVEMVCSRAAPTKSRIGGWLVVPLLSW